MILEILIGALIGLAVAIPVMVWGASKLSTNVFDRQRKLQEEIDNKIKVPELFYLYREFSLSLMYLEQAYGNKELPYTFLQSFCLNRYTSYHGYPEFLKAVFTLNFFYYVYNNEIAGNPEIAENKESTSAEATADEPGINKDLLIDATKKMISQLEIIIKKLDEEFYREHMKTENSEL